MRRVIQFSFIIGFVLLVGSAFPQAGSAARLETAPNLYHVKPFSQSLNLDGKEIRLDLSPNPFLHPFTKPLSADIPGSWYPLGRGTTGDVSAMILNSKFDSLGNLYAGGYFSNLINADGNPVPNTYGIAVWNGNVWNAVGQGISSGGNSYVETLVIDSNDNLYIAGTFSSVKNSDGSIVANTAYLAKWDGIEWSSLGQGVDNGITSLGIDSSNNIYVGGPFTSAKNPDGATVPNTARIAKWDGATWSALGQGIGGSDPYNRDFPTTMAVDNNDNLFVGGFFTTAYDSNGISVPYTSKVAKWDGTNWSPLGQGADDWVADFAFDSNNDLYIAGYFTELKDNNGLILPNTRGLAKWDGYTFQAVGGESKSYVGEIEFDQWDNLYAESNFTWLSDPKINQISRWDGVKWHALGYGIPELSIFDITLASDGDIYVSGYFPNALDDTGNPVPYTDDIARWHPLLGTNTTINSHTPDPSTIGRSYAVSISVTSSTGTPSGTVDVDDGEGNSCQITLASGSGSCNLTTTTLGAKTLTAWYSGDGSYLSSSATTSHTVIESVIFSDGFESGDMSSWSSFFGASGEIQPLVLCKLCVLDTAALIGNFGLRVRAPNIKPHYLTDESPAGETRYRARFYINIRNLNMDHLNNFRIFQGRIGTTIPFFLQVRKNDTKYQIRARIRTDDGLILKTKWTPLPKTTSIVEMDWRAAKSASRHNGFIKLWVNGYLRRAAIGVDNDTYNIDHVRLGITAPVKAHFNISGAFRLDSFISDRVNYIGP